MMPKVSVVMPVYNQAAYLGECLDSVLSQTLSDIEVICVDDGSTDRSALLLDEYAARDGRLRVIRQANAGAGPARNAGIAAAAGEYIAFMDADDRYPDERVLEELCLTAGERGAAVCGGSLVTTDGRVLEPELVFSKDGFQTYADYQYEFGYYRFIFRRTLLLEHKVAFPALRRFQDVPFLVEAMHAAGSFYALRRATYLYRVGHQVVEWSASNAAKAVDNVKGMIAVRDLALRYGYARMAERTERRLVDFIRLLGSEANGLRSHRDALILEVDGMRQEMSDLKSSVSFRLGRLLTAPLRLCRNMMKGKKS